MTRTEIMGMLNDVYALKLKIEVAIQEMRDDAKTYGNLRDLFLCERDAAEMFNDFADMRVDSRRALDVMDECEHLAEFWKMSDSECRMWLYDHMDK